MCCSVSSSATRVIDQMGFGECVAGTPLEKSLSQLSIFYE